MSRLLMVVLGAVLVGCGPAAAQVGGIGASPLGMTSPLGIGPASPVAPTGIPLGATELASPGVSPMTSGTSPLVPGIGGSLSCSTMAGSNPQAFSGTAMSTPGISGMVGTSPVRAQSSTVAAWRGLCRAPVPRLPAARWPDLRLPPPRLRGWASLLRSRAWEFRWGRPSWGLGASVHRPTFSR